MPFANCAAWDSYFPHIASVITSIFLYEND
ncbi:hypothetical protein I7I48_04877 [Histoplasma ohiense]|nr:hypothetical protein I7I48_04877 [Histoplasma ohiense (nom. inval.)]